MTDSTRTAHVAAAAAGTCPSCGREVGATHQPFCPVLYQVITTPGRRGNLVHTFDIAVTSCGCPTATVAGRGREGGHRPACRRATWITPVDPPTNPGVNKWTVAYTAVPFAGNSPLVHTATTAPEHHMVGGFDTWQEAAGWLDTLARAATITPLGVFCALPKATVDTYATWLDERTKTPATVAA